ncbi:lysophospholipid acyltransferase family protein [Tenacibaculum sp. SG-28]|uniref:lysophospholipid acyltransferase family protein n=1 Tax=Tenacibaculum sp. SG-28 TaxID=754426 RepID=UPI000CF37FFB|nr:lysophospholipid acyltransferase family protein [Tenacibaculum sp. SG-28]PQJ23040.1 hypothetical protein BSU00_01890 [Tenacibaculum sp. SG-28]
MQDFIYLFFKLFIKTGLFFYTKKIKVTVQQPIPKDGAIVFAANHPNGLIDPLVIATSISRKTNFLVRAGVFNNKIVSSFFDILGMMPVYRIRDGIQQLSKNQAIFNKCEKLLKKNEAILIFPEGSHNKKRTIRPLSKGFTRIIHQTLEHNPETKIYVIPIGITYQNPSEYPLKLAVNIGTPICANSSYEQDQFTSVKYLKSEVSKQLEGLTVHIKDDENYSSIVQSLNKAQVDYTEVSAVNQMIQQKETVLPKKIKSNYFKPLLFLLIINGIIPYIIWKRIAKKINEFEFIDTFRFGSNLILYPTFLLIQTGIICYFLNSQIAWYYSILSVVLVMLYSKIAPTPPK